VRRSGSLHEASRIVVEIEVEECPEDYGDDSRRASRLSHIAARQPSKRRGDSYQGP
jgi:hypothetical protein